MSATRALAPAERFPRGAEVIERLRYGGYVPLLTPRGIIVKRGPRGTNKQVYAQWIDHLRDKGIAMEAKNYMRLTHRPRRKRTGRR